MEDVFKQEGRCRMAICRILSEKVCKRLLCGELTLTLLLVAIINVGIGQEQTVIAGVKPTAAKVCGMRHQGCADSPLANDARVITPIGLFTPGALGQDWYRL